MEKNNARNTEIILEALCSHLSSESSARSSELFTELVYSMRDTTPEALKAAYNTLLNKEFCQESTKTEYGPFLATKEAN